MPAAAGHDSEADGGLVRIADSEIHVWWLRPDPTGAGSFTSPPNAAGGALNLDYRADVRRRAHAILARYVGRPPDDLGIERDAHGRTSTILGGRTLRFSLSHSGNAGVLATAVGFHVGIDLEDVAGRVGAAGGYVGAAAVSARFFTPDEADWIRRLDEPARTAAFFRLWTSKEAYLKGVGGRVPRDLSRCTIEASTGSPRIASTRLEGADGRSAWMLVPVTAPDRFAAALASERPSPSVREFDA